MTGGSEGRDERKETSPVATATSDEVKGRLASDGPHAVSVDDVFAALDTNGKGMTCNRAFMAAIITREP